MITEQGIGELMPRAGSVRTVEETVNQVAPGAGVELQDDETAADGTGVEVSGEASVDAVLDRPELARLKQFWGRSLDIASLEIVDGEALEFGAPAAVVGQDAPGVMKQKRVEAGASADEVAELQNLAQRRNAAGDVPGLHQAERRDASAVEMRRRENDIAARGVEMVGSRDDSGVHGQPIAGSAEASSPRRSAAELEMPDTNVKGLAGRSQETDRARMEEELAMMARLRRREMRVERGR